jgi:hypothetical protein
MARQERIELIKEIEEKRDSRVIAYVTSDRQGLETQIEENAIPFLHRHVDALPPDDRKKIDLFIYSRGGASDVPWTIVSMLREYCGEGELGVLIPYKAHSAATIIALGADEIVMGKKAELGPIDITIGRGPYNPAHPVSKQPLPISVEDVTGFFSLLDRVGCERPEEKMRGFEKLCSEVHPLALGYVNRLLQQTELVALRMLDTRSRPFTEEKNREIVRRLSSEIFSHRHTISRTEAIQQLGLEQVVKSEDASIMKPLWTLFKEYRDLFSLDEPFKPEQHLLDNDLEEHTWTDLNLVAVESRERLDIQQANVHTKRGRQVPPNPQFNINLPQFALPQLPPGLQPAQIQQILQQFMSSIVQPAIEQAIKDATERLVKSMPTVNFVHNRDVTWKEAS